VLTNNHHSSCCATATNFRLSTCLEHPHNRERIQKDVRLSVLRLQMRRTRKRLAKQLPLVVPASIELDREQRLMWQPQ
jgi:hypothetical protein